MHEKPEEHDRAPGASHALPSEQGSGHGDDVRSDVQGTFAAKDEGSGTVPGGRGADAAADADAGADADTGTDEGADADAAADAPGGSPVLQPAAAERRKSSLFTRPAPDETAVEQRGIEPRTSALRTQRSPS